MNKPSDQYSFWRRSLAGHKEPMHEGQPESGFYRMKERNGVDSSVAYWTDEKGVQHCSLNGKLVPLARAIELWTFVCARPVSHEDFQHRKNEGRWLNDAPVLTDLDTRGTDAPRAGHNKPPADESVEAIASALSALEVEARRMLEAGAAKSKPDADKASDVANALGEVEKRAVTAHKVEKAPIITAGKVCDGKWFPIRDKAADLKSKLKLRVVTPWMVHLRHEQEATLAKARAEGVDTTGMDEKVRAGSLRRTSALKTIKSAKINDYSLAINHFAGHPEVRELIQRLADRTVRAGSSVPGCAILESEVAV